MPNYLKFARRLEIGPPVGGLGIGHFTIFRRKLFKLSQI
jgi:hypothetical protein